MAEAPLNGTPSYEFKHSPQSNTPWCWIATLAAPTRHFLFSCTQGGYARQCTSVHVSARQRSCTPGISRTPACDCTSALTPGFTPKPALTPGFTPTPAWTPGFMPKPAWTPILLGSHPLYFNLMFVSSPRDREIVASIHLVLPRHTVKCCPFSPATM